jgi:hypothetical protein
MLACRLKRVGDVKPCLQRGFCAGLENSITMSGWTVLVVLDLIWLILQNKHGHVHMGAWGYHLGPGARRYRNPIPGV